MDAGANAAAELHTETRTMVMATVSCATPAHALSTSGHVKGGLNAGPHGEREGAIP
jgi:hypothetical protein